ncbi:MAG: tetratricopeptide repeat protein [Spirochaetaceae bacterium]
MRFRAIGIVVLTLFAATAALSGCRTQDEYYVVGNEEQQKELQRLFALLEEETEAEREMVLIDEIAGYLVNAGHPGRMRTLLTTFVERNPNHPYNAYFLLLVAEQYRESSPQMARHYYDRVVSNYADLRVNGTSVHYKALRELVRLTDEPGDRLTYYHELVDRFSEHIDPGTTYYHMARTHEQLGEWDEAYEDYKNFLRHPDTEIRGVPQAREQVQQRVEFYDSSKDWTMESLDELVATIKTALRRQDADLLLRYRAGVNFFAMSWEQDQTDFNSQVPFDLGIFLQRSRVSFAEDIDINSNAREAYLRTWGWSHRIRTWYLYFRRVDFPADPEINGNWEWAGIFFGDAL